MESLDWKTRLLIYTMMKRMTPNAPGWLVVAEHLWRQRNIIQQSVSVLASSHFAESSWQYTLTTLKSGLRTYRSYRERLCCWSTVRSTNKMCDIDKDYAFICTTEQDALQAVQECGQKQKILCLRETKWPTQAYSLR